MMIPGFYHASKSYYFNRITLSDRAIDEIMIGLYAEDGGTSGEFGIRWYHIGLNISPRIEIYDDAWQLLGEFSNLFSQLSMLANTDPSPDEMASLLIDLGFKDLTKKESPDKPG